MFGYITARAFIWAASLTSCRALHGTAPRRLHVLHHITPLATRQHVWHQMPCGGCAVMSITSSWLPPPLGSLHGITNAPAAAFLWGLWALLLYDCCITHSPVRGSMCCAVLLTSCFQGTLIHDKQHFYAMRLTARCWPVLRYIQGLLGYIPPATYRNGTRNRLLGRARVF
jgi:hypothetical protein